MSKTIFITGSTDGIGKLAALSLLKEGHAVILHGRNEDKVSRTVSELKSQSGNSKIYSFIADLSDFKAIAWMCEDVLQKFEEIDVLINNAGVFKSSQLKTKEGYDLRMMVNYLAPFYITKQLLPIISKSSDGRIINLSSAAQDSVSLDFLKGKDEVTVSAAYAQSKLALTMWSFDLGQRLEHITVIPVNPGSLLNTKMVQEAYGKFWSSASKGSDILHLLAVDPKYKNVVGQYFDNDLGNPLGRFGNAHPDAYDQELINELIETTKFILQSLS